LLAGGIGVAAGIGGSFVGVFPMDYVRQHGFAAMTFFNLGWIAVGLASVDFVVHRDPRFPRRVAIVGLAAVAAFIGFLAILGLPTTNGFLSEFFLFQGGFIRATDTATLYRIVVSILGVVATAFTAGYSLWTLRRVFFGPTNEITADVKEAPWTVTGPLIILCIVTIALGIYPQPVLGPLLNAAKTIQGVPGVPGL